MTFKELIASERPVLIDFYADWCGPCKAFAPVLMQLKEEVGDTAQIVKIDVDKNQELSVKYDIKSIPTVMIFQNGELKWRQRGAQPLFTMKNQIKSLLHQQEQAKEEEE